MMTLPYFLRQLSRKHGTNYALAVNNLVDLCSQVGMPREAKMLIMEELEQVLRVENDEVLRAYAGGRLEVYGESDAEEEEETSVAVEKKKACLTEAVTEIVRPNSDAVRDKEYWEDLNMRTSILNGSANTALTAEQNGRDEPKPDKPRQETNTKG